MIEKKKVGMIRKGAVVPFLIVTVLIVLFNLLFLDSTIKKSIEYFGGKVNGAEVNVDSVKTSFSSLSVEVKKIAFTNASDPAFNLFEVGSLKFQMMWDGVLRGKVVIDESSIKDITIAGKRKALGKVYPKPLEDPKNPSKAKETLQNAKEEFKGNVFGDISALLAGDSSKDVLNNIENELESKKFYEALEKQIDQKEEELKTMMSNLPKSAEIDSYDDRFKAINWDDLKNISKAPKVLKEADSLRKDVSNTIKQYNDAVKRVESEIKFVKDSTKQVEGLIKQDVDRLESKMSLPNLDSKAIAGVLFGPDFVNSMAKYDEYFAMAKKYMPPKKDKKEVVEVKPPRGEGVNYQFGTPKSYPLFWLKHSEISSQNSQGTVSGKIENVTTDQSVVNKPTTAQIDADFPSQNLRQLKAKVSIDHRGVVKDSVQLSIGAFPVKEKALSQSDAVSFIMSSATSSSVVSADLIDKSLTMKLDNTFSDVKYKTEAKTKVVKEILDSVASDASTVTLNAKASGSIEKLNFDINTNLADIIKTAVGRVISEKINAAKKKIKDTIENKLAGNKKKVDEKLDQLKSKYQGEIDKQKSKIDGITSKIDGKKDSAKNSVQDKGKDLLKGLKKKFKF